MITGFKKDALGDYIEKTPQSVLDYKRSWVEWLGADTILNSVWEVPAGLVAGIAQNDTTSTTQWLSGGTVGQTYTVKNRITTTGGRQETFSFRVLCKDG